MGMFIDVRGYKVLLGVVSQVSRVCSNSTAAAQGSGNTERGARRGPGDLTHRRLMDRVKDRRRGEVLILNVKAGHTVTKPPRMQRCADERVQTGAEGGCQGREVRAAFLLSTFPAGLQLCLYHWVRAGGASRWVPWVQGRSMSSPHTHILSIPCQRYRDRQGSEEPSPTFSVLVHLGCYNQTPQTEQLKQQTRISPSSGG